MSMAAVAFRQRDYSIYILHRSGRANQTIYIYIFKDLDLVFLIRFAAKPKSGDFLFTCYGSCVSSHLG